MTSFGMDAPNAPRSSLMRFSNCLNWATALAFAATSSRRRSMHPTPECFELSVQWSASRCNSGKAARSDARASTIMRNNVRRLVSLSITCLSPTVCIEWPMVAPMRDFFVCFSWYGNEGHDSPSARKPESLTRQVTDLQCKAGRNRPCPRRSALRTLHGTAIGLRTCLARSGEAWHPRHGVTWSCRRPLPAPPAPGAWRRGDLR